MALANLDPPTGETPGSVFCTDDQLDSVQRLTLVVAIEDHFKICFEPEDEAQVHSLEDLVTMIEAKLSET